jgi:hypothetical protein
MYLGNQKVSRQERNFKRPFGKVPFTIGNQIRHRPTAAHGSCMPTFICDIVSANPAHKLEQQRLLVPVERTIINSQ